MKTRAFIIALLFAGNLAAESTRIEVYPAGRIYVDVIPGDTLGEIIRHQVPGNRALQQRLMQQVVQLNPHAFDNADPDRLKAHVRLWLPGHVSDIQKTLDHDRYHIRAFSWGYVRQAK